ncbi:MAG: cation transporting ATPase C-terminal domain-containing protein [Clostridia bacterium]|nr:cation transporting ATPase C-terminal domain-containing protein [Clostridia bacterium]
MRAIATGGLLLAGTVLTAARAAWAAAGAAGLPPGPAQVSAAFAAWMVGHVLLAFAMRTVRAPLRVIGLFSNRALNLWTLAVLVTVPAVVGVPALQGLFRTGPLPPAGWAGVVVALVALAAALAVARRWWRWDPATARTEFSGW